MASPCLQIGLGVGASKILVWNVGTFFIAQLYGVRHKPHPKLHIDAIPPLYHT